MFICQYVGNEIITFKRPICLNDLYAKNVESLCNSILIITINYGKELYSRETISIWSQS